VPTSNLLPNTFKNPKSALRLMADLRITVHNFCGLACILRLTSLTKQVSLTTNERSARWNGARSTPGPRFAGKLPPPAAQPGPGGNLSRVHRPTVAKQRVIYFWFATGYFFYRDGALGRNGLFLVLQVIHFKIRGRTESRGCVLQI